MRKYFILIVIIILIITSYLIFLNSIFIILGIVIYPLAILGLYDYFQTKHSITRNFPIIGHARYILESLGPEIRQYFIESDTTVSYTHLRAHETVLDLVCRLLLEKKKQQK